jgi:hypothetical protein
MSWKLVSIRRAALLCQQMNPRPLGDMQRWLGTLAAASLVTWAMLAAGQGAKGPTDAKGQLELALKYLHGEGVPQDYKLALDWLKKSAGQNYAPAQYSLGFFNAAGYGMPAPSLREAASWYRKAADQGHAEAQYKLAFCYEKGLGVSASTKEALAWYIKAAEQGVAEAQLAVGDAYFEGKGVEKNVGAAVKWYGDAAGKRLAEAQFKLGLRWRNGDVGNKDYVEAYKWFLLASRKGYELATDQLEFMKRIDSYGMKDPKKQAEAEARAREVEPD